MKIKFKGVGKIGDPLNWRANIDCLKSLGFRSKVSLAEGINNYCKWLGETN